MQNVRTIGRFTTSGQPEEADFARLANDGIELVINVRDPEDVVPDEQMWAARAGIAYATTFVDSENPTVEQVRSVRTLLPPGNAAKVLIH
jgi:protein tyrosine phosphatase (PTP) superfamily phosphohydrolase (DUF442 family)